MMIKCCFCGTPIEEKYANSTYPVRGDDEKCCDACNMSIVVQARLNSIRGNKTNAEKN